MESLEAFSEPVLTVKRPCATKWLSLNTSLSTHEGILEDGDDTSGIALESWKFAATSYFLWDVLGDLAQLSKAFQKSDLPIHGQFQLVTSTLGSLKTQRLLTVFVI